MQLHLLREPTRQGATLGALYVDGVWQCWTIEDALREVNTQAAHVAATHGGPTLDAWVRSWKVAGQTAIPAGTYPVTITYSPRFGRQLPLVGQVPGFEGIRIHPGNTIADTEGCILPGADRDRTRVLRSRVAFQVVYETIEGALGRGEAVTLTVLNPLAGWAPQAPKQPGASLNA